VTRARILNLGAGWQSSAMLLMAAEGVFDGPMPDLAVFADVGGGTTPVEPEAVYPWIDFLRRTVGERIPMVTATEGDLFLDLVAAAAGETTRVSNPPVFTLDEAGNRGMARRKCSRDYKVRAVERELRRRGYGPARPVEQWIGISFDELERMKRPDDTPKWIDLRWPLVEQKITRQDCVDWMRERGYTGEIAPVKSACVFCPYHSDGYWRQMRDERPAEWQLAVTADRVVRRLPGLDGDGFLHVQRVPLEEAVLALEDVGQLPMFEEESDPECGGGCFL
jgi:hypothetical protein